MEKILAFATEQPRLEHFLPDDIDLPKVPKQWVVNVCAAVLGDAFKDWVGEQVEERNALMADKKEIMIAMDAGMAQKFAASTHVSCKYNCTVSSLMISLFHSVEGRVSKHAEDLLEAAQNSHADQG